VTSWEYNFKGSIGSRKQHRRCVSFLYGYYICVLLICVIIWAAVKDELVKTIFLLLIVFLSIPLSWISAIYFIYFASRWGYSWYYRCIRKQRKSLVGNNIELRNTLLAFREQVPNMVQLKWIEGRSRKYLQNIQTLINERLNIDTELILTGSAAERYSVPFTSLQRNYETSNDCISQFTFCCQESLQREELVRLHNLKHAILSDCDCMISPTNYMVNFNDNEKRQKYQATVKEFPFYIMSDDNGAQFYAKKQKEDLLHIIEKLDVKSIPWDISGDENGKNFVELYISGPALTLKLGSTESRCKITNMNFYGDITYSLKCPEWPDICDWGRRPNTKQSNKDQSNTEQPNTEQPNTEQSNTEQPNTEQPNKKWPQSEEVERIKSFGCHFVPKSDPEDLEGVTWRISFSKAEVELSKLVPEAARLCFVGLKVIVKDYLTVVCKKFRSYHLKCIFLHTLEITEPSIWKEDNLEICFDVLLKSLRTCLENEMVPNFWLSTENLLKDFTKKDFEKLLEQLTRVEKDPKKFIEPLRQGKPVEYDEFELTENYGPSGYEIDENDFEVDVLIQ